MEKEDEQQRLQIEVKNSNNEKANFEKAVLLTGYGRYHVALLFVCGFVILSVGFQNGLSAYILPSAQCDLQLNSREMGMVHAAFLIGGTISAMLWGVVADAIGRKNILMLTLIIDGIVTLISSTSQTYIVFLIFRFLNGFIIGAPGSLVFSYLGEFYSEKERTKAICLLGFFWTVSWIILPAFAWIIIPLDFNFHIFGFLFNSWRLFVGVFALPSLISACLLSYYPESPRFLLSQGKSKEALKIMRQMFSANNGKSEHEYPVTALIGDPSMTDNDEASFSELLGNMWKQICCLFSSPLLKYTILFSAIIYTNIFGYYGLSLWLPELFNRFESYYRLHPNASVRVCELTGFRQDGESTTAKMAASLNVMSNVTSDFASVYTNYTAPPVLIHLIEDCDSSVDPKVFINTILIGLTCLVANLASAYLSDRLGRRTLPIMLSLISGICGCLIYFLRSTTQNLIVACLFSAFASIGNIIVTGIMVDIFPTSVNAMAICTSCFAGRLGAITSNLLFGLLLDISCEVPIFLVGGLLMLSGFLGFFIPKGVLKISKPEEKAFIS